MVVRRTVVVQGISAWKRLDLVVRRGDHTHKPRTMTMTKLSPVAWRGITTLLFSTIIIFFPSPSSIDESARLVEGLVNVAPFSQVVGCCPIRRHTRLYNSHDAITVTTADELQAIPTSAISTDSSALVGDVASHDTQASTLQTIVQPRAPLPSTISADTASRNSQKSDKPAKRMGVWMPPSKNLDQRRGKIFSIQQPQDLLDFVIEDERLSVGELSINHRHAVMLSFVLYHWYHCFANAYHLQFKSKFMRAGVKHVKSLMYVIEV